MELLGGKVSDFEFQVSAQARFQHLFEAGDPFYELGFGQPET
jgi:hypothetical protein